MSDIGKNLKDARTEAGIYQEDAARKMGMSRPTLSAIENNKREVSLVEMQGFSKLYGVSIDYLISGSDVKKRLEAYLKALNRITSSYQKEVDGVIGEMKKEFYIDGENADDKC